MQVHIIYQVFILSILFPVKIDHLLNHHSALLLVPFVLYICDPVCQSNSTLTASQLNFAPSKHELHLAIDKYRLTVIGYSTCSQS